MLSASLGRAAAFVGLWCGPTLLWEPDRGGRAAPSSQALTAAPTDQLAAPKSRQETGSQAIFSPDKNRAHSTAGASSRDTETQKLRPQRAPTWRGRTSTSSWQDWGQAWLQPGSGREQGCLQGGQGPGWHRCSSGTEWWQDEGRLRTRVPSAAAARWRGRTAFLPTCTAPCSAAVWCSAPVHRGHLAWPPHTHS